MAKSLNKVQLIGNLTKDPELRYTPNGKAVCSFGIATNRYWITETGEKKEEADFHNIVAWGKLAELCSQFLVKGRKTYVEGRLSTRSWTGQDGVQKSRTDIIIDDMILLDSKGVASASNAAVANTVAVNSTAVSADEKEKKIVKTTKKQGKEEESVKEEDKGEEVSPDDIPF